MALPILLLNYCYRYDIVAASTRVDLGLYQDIYNAFISAATDFAKTTDGTMQMSLQPLTTHAILEGKNRGGNALDLAVTPTNCESCVPCPFILIVLSSQLWSTHHMPRVHDGRIMGD